jgi:hypothetical protein
VKRLLSVIQHRDAQYKHELKKKEREQTRLKDRLNKMLADKADRKIGEHHVIGRIILGQQSSTLFCDNVNNIDNS